MKTRYPLRWSIQLGILVIAVLRVFDASKVTAADEAASGDAVKTEAKTAADLGTEEVARWTFRLPNDPKAELKFVSTPILKWTNPTVGRVYGNVYVITHDGCPRAIVCPYKWFAPYQSLDMECLSVTSQPIEGVRNQNVVWSAKSSGLEWKPVPGEPVVGKTPLERQRQMKKLAEEFTAEMFDTRVNIGGEDQQLRPMTQPVYRYESPSRAVLEGGVFAYVVGTDPELFLMLQAIEKDGSRQWQYGLARMSMDSMRMKHQQKDVWQAEKLTLETLRNMKQPYFCFNVPKS